MPSSLFFPVDTYRHRYVLLHPFTCTLNWCRRMSSEVAATARNMSETCQNMFDWQAERGGTKCLCAQGDVLHCLLWRSELMHTMRKPLKRHNASPWPCSNQIFFLLLFLGGPVLCVSYKLWLCSDKDTGNKEAITKQMKQCSLPLMSNWSWYPSDKSLTCQFPAHDEWLEQAAPHEPTN